MPTLILHGSYGLESPRDDVRQTKYGCTDCEDDNQGYLEILHVASPPPGRKPFLVHYHMRFARSPRSPNRAFFVRLEVCCDSRIEALRVYEELSKLFYEGERLMVKITLLGHEVRHLNGEELPWVYEPHAEEGTA